MKNKITSQSSKFVYLDKFKGLERLLRAVPKFGG